MELIAKSDFFDPEWYLGRYKDVARAGVDPLSHFCHYGWKENRNPSARFNVGYYLTTYKDVAKAGINPLCHFIKYGQREGRRPLPPVQPVKPKPPAPTKATVQPPKPKTPAPAVAAKTTVAVNQFDPGAYLALYPDVAASGKSALDHYRQFGISEGRSNGITAPKAKGGGKLFSVSDGGEAFDDSKPSCIIVAHESSRTGCPINTWSMLCELSKKYNVLAISLSPGPLDDLFRKNSTRFIVFDGFVRNNAAYLIHALSGVLQNGNYRFAIVNSVVSRATLPALAWCRIPSVVCVHEFAQYCNKEDLKAVFLYGTKVVYSSHICLDATAEAIGINPDDAAILAQGISSLPVDRSVLPPYNERFMLNRLQQQKQEKGETFVLGVGSVEYRKGFDIFLRVASFIKAKDKTRNWRFIWAGAGYDPVRRFESKLHKAQIDYLGLSDSFSYLGSIEFMDRVYQLSDVFLLPSILDPLPGVVIEAMSHKLPVVCFDKASGFPEMYRAAGIDEACVAPSLDAEAMARLAIRLVEDPEWRNKAIHDQTEFFKREFDMPSYVEKIEALALEAADAFGQRTGHLSKMLRTHFLLNFRAEAAQRLNIADYSRSLVKAEKYSELTPVIYGLEKSVPLDVKHSGDELYALVGHNTGNLAFHYAIEASIEAKPRVLPWHCTEHVEDGTVGIVPAANQLGPHCDMSIFAEWLRNTDMPMVAIGLGAQAEDKKGVGALDYNTPIISEETKKWIRLMAEHSPSDKPNISMRGLFSLRVMKELGLGKNAVALGCPTLFISPQCNLGAEIGAKCGKFGRIAFAAGQKGWGRLKRFSNDMSKIITQTDGAFVVQAASEELKMLNGEYATLEPKIREALRNHFRADLPEEDFVKWVVRYGRVFYDIPQWMDFYRQFDFVVGPRIHGTMIALQAGVPTMCIAIDSRTTELCEMMKVPYVPASEIKGGVTIDDLKRLFKFDPAVFDTNRRTLAQGFVKFLRDNKISPSVQLLNIAGM